MNNNRYLLLIWKDPQTGRNFTIGKLCRNDKYTFEYYGEFSKAENHGWSKLEVFPEEKIYESDTLFTVFASRLPDKKRRDIDEILRKYNLTTFDEFELLRKSSAKLPIDTYYFIDPILDEEDKATRDFFVMGIRHHCPCRGENCELLPPTSVNDDLILEHENDNEYDPNAIKILTKDNEFLGYVPSYYSESISKLLKHKTSYTCKVLDINRNKTCSECIKVRLQML